MYGGDAGGVRSLAFIFRDMASHWKTGAEERWTWSLYVDRLQAVTLIDNGVWWQ
jgi:hypothetical protein